MITWTTVEERIVWTATADPSYQFVTLRPTSVTLESGGGGPHVHAASDVTSGQLATARVASGTATAGFVPTVDGSGNLALAAPAAGDTGYSRSFLLGGM